MRHGAGSWIRGQSEAIASCRTTRISESFDAWFPGAAPFAGRPGLVERSPDEGDGRVIRVRLTPGGEERLGQLSSAHLDELRRLVLLLDHLTAGEP